MVLLVCAVSYAMVQCLVSVYKLCKYVVIVIMIYSFVKYCFVLTIIVYSTGPSSHFSQGMFPETERYMRPMYLMYQY